MTDGEHGKPLGHNAIRVEIVTTTAQLQHAFAVRAISFMEDTGLPVDHAFDGNDLQATHVVIYMHDEPIGSLRIRWFNDFAKIERTGFRKAYRHPRHLKTTAEYVFKHIARKGYTKVITHASPAYARLWRSLLGFREVAGKDPAIYHDEPHVELIKELTVPDNAITLATNTAVLFRTEGSWDRAEKYEVQR
jgi:hypothetical protein